MTEREYIIATNLAKVRIAYDALADCTVTCGEEDFGMTIAQREAIMNPLYDVRDKMYQLAKIDEEPETTCDHGRGWNDYCEPCGRIHGGV